MLNYRKNTALNAKAWQYSGLDFLLIEDDSRRAELKKVNVKTHVQVQKPVFEFKNDNAKNLQSSPRSSEEAKERDSVQTNSNIQILKEYEWPNAWNDLWTKIAKHDAPKIAWTYTGLHDDILGNENTLKERQEIIRELIMGLKSPHGTHAFIPYDKEHEQGKLYVHEESSFYWSAISRFKVKHLFVFGSKARDELLLPARGVNSVLQFRNCRVYILPDINRLIGNMAEVKALLEYLKNQLSSVKI